MIRMYLLGEPRPVGLFGREEALLRLRYFAEPSSCFLVRARHRIFPQLSWGIMRHRRHLRNLDSKEGAISVYFIDYKSLECQHKSPTFLGNCEGPWDETEH